MTCKQHRFIVLAIGFCALLSQLSYGQSLPFRDSFTDGWYDDGEPVTWSPWSNSQVEVEEGSLVVGTTKGVGSAEVRDMLLTDTSLRTEFRLVSGQGAFVYVLSQSRPDVPNGYAAGIAADGKASIVYDGNGQVLAETQTDFDPAEDFLQLQLDAIDDVVQLWIWHAGDAMPTSPLLSFTDKSEFEFEGWAGVAAWGNDAEAAFRYVHLGESTIVLGDFDGNGILDASDIDAMSGDLENDLFDLDDDGDVDLDDRSAWIRDLRQAWYGDTNLDGEFNSGDLVAVFEAGKYEQDVVASWSEGDWDGDGRFGSGDLVTAFNDGGFEQGPRITANAVPEPASLVLLITALIGVSIRRRCVVA